MNIRNVNNDHNILCVTKEIRGQRWDDDVKDIKDMIEDDNNYMMREIYVYHLKIKRY